MRTENAMVVHGPDDGKIWLDLEAVETVRIPERMGSAMVSMRSGYSFTMPRETAAKLIGQLTAGGTEHWPERQGEEIG